MPPVKACAGRPWERPEQAETRAEAAAPGLDPAQLVIVVDPSPGTYSVRVRATYPRTEVFPIPGITLPATIQSVAEQRVE